MVSTFLQLSQDHAMPPSASVTFHTAHFDPESGNKRGYGYFYPILMHKPSGLYVLKAYLNYYMLSKVSSYQISHLLTILVSAEQEDAGLPPCDGVHADREQPPLQHPHQDRRHQHPVIELTSAVLELTSSLTKLKLNTWSYDITTSPAAPPVAAAIPSDNYL